MGKHKTTNCSLKDSLEKRKKIEQERRKQEKETINKIKDIVPFKKQADTQFVKKDFLRCLTGHLKFSHTFKETNVEPLPADIDGVFQSLLRSDDVNVFVCTGDMNIIYCSESSFKSLGYQPIDVLGLKLSSLVYNRDRSKFEEQINGIKNDIIGSEHKMAKPFNLTCRMRLRKSGKNDTDKCHLVRISGLVEYRENLVTKKVAIEKAKNTHLSIRDEESVNHETAIVIRGSIGLIKDPDYLSSQINYMLVNLNEYRLVMDPTGNILHATHTMVNIIGWQSFEVQFRNAYEFIHEDDRTMSLAAHLITLQENDGVIVQRLKDVNKKPVYLQVYGVLEAKDGRVLFVTHATQLSEEEGEKRRKEYAKKLEHLYENKSFEELLHQVQVTGKEKITQLLKTMKQESTKSCVDEPTNSPRTDTSLQTNTSSFSSSPSSSSLANSSLHSVMYESVEAEFADMDSFTSGQSSNPSSLFSSQSSPLATLSSTSPTLPSSSSQSFSSAPVTRSPLSQPPPSQSPPIQSFTPQATSAAELQSTRFLSDSSSTLQPTQAPTQAPTPISTTISINYPTYNPQIIMRPTQEHLIQNQYYQFGNNHCNIIITTQTYPEQPTLFGTPFNQQIILNQTSFCQYPTYNYNNAGPIVHNVATLDINAELQKVNINDFVYQLDSDSDSDLKK